MIVSPHKSKSNMSVTVLDFYNFGAPLGRNILRQAGSTRLR